MSRTKSAFLGVISSQSFMVVSILVNLAATPFIVKALNSEIYGLSIIIFQITSYLGMFDFGLSSGVGRFLAGAKGDDQETKTRIQKIISTSFMVYAILGAMVAVTGVLLAPFVAGFFNAPANYIHQVKYIVSSVCILVGLQFLLRAISGIFFAHQRQVLSHSLSFILGISNTVMVIIFIYSGHGLWSFVYAQIVVFIFNSILNIYFFKKHYGDIVISIKNFDFRLLKEMFSYGFFLFLTGVAVQIVFYTQRILIGSIISLSAVSLYALNVRLPELFFSVLCRITENSFPAMVEISKGNNITALKSVHDRIMQLTMSLSTAAFWMILLISYPFIRLWVGEEFYGGLTFIILISYLYLIQHTYIHVTSVCLNSAGIVKGLSMIALIEAGINLALSIWLGKTFGMIGIIAATIIASVITSGWYVPYVAVKNKNFGLSSYIITIFRPVLTISALGIIVYMLLGNIFYSIDTWIELILYSFSVGTMFVILLFLLNRTLLINLKSKIFPKKNTIYA